MAVSWKHETSKSITKAKTYSICHMHIKAFFLFVRLIETNEMSCMRIGAYGECLRTISISKNTKKNTKIHTNVQMVCIPVRLPVWYENSLKVSNTKIGFSFNKISLHFSRFIWFVLVYVIFIVQCSIFTPNATFHSNQIVTNAWFTLIFNLIIFRAKQKEKEPNGTERNGGGRGDGDGKKVQHVFICSIH